MLQMLMCFSCCAARSGASLHHAHDTDAEIELIIDQLTQGTIEDRGTAAERLFNKAAEDETARQKAAAAGVIQPLVCCPLVHAVT